MKKIISMIQIIIAIYIIFPISIIAIEGDFDFTDASSNEFGEGWLWNNTDKTLILSGVTIDKALKLPENSSIEITNNTTNIIAITDTVPITATGNLTISGSGSLTIQTNSDKTGFNTINGITDLYVENINLTTSGLTGLMAENVVIKNAVIDIYGYRYGIHSSSKTEGKNLKVNLINCTGKITGKLLQGIEISNQKEGDIELNIENCNDLIVSGNTTNKGLSGVFERSGARLYTINPKSNATVNIKNSNNINFYGTNTGIAIDCHSDDSSVLEGNGKSSLIINNSTVLAETITNTWSAFFINNNGVGVDATSEILIQNSIVKALAPNDVAIMTSTKNTASSVTIRNSILELAGVYAGIRAKSNTSLDAEIYVIEKSLIVVVDKISKNYKALDEMDKGTSSDGISGVDEDSVVVSPKDCEIIIKEDGNWEIPDEGTVLINGEEKKFTYGGVIKESGEVLPYITSLNDTEFSDLNEALSKAQNGDNIILFTSDNIKDTNLPLGITITSPSAIPVNTNEYGYKVKEEIIDEKYVYSVIPKNKYKVTYHLNNGEDKTVTKEVFEQSDYTIEKDIFLSPQGMKFGYWIINGEKYLPDDIYYITNDIDIYAQWVLDENPETYDNVINIFWLTIISLICFIIIMIYCLKNNNIKNRFNAIK